jgi:hypothetical protein
MNIFVAASRTHSATIGGGALLSEPSGKTFMVHPHVAPEAEQPEEELEGFPETQRQLDLFRTAVIHRIVNDETILGQVEDIEQHKVTKEKLYRIKYMDGYQECLTANQMREGMVTCNPLDLVYGIIAERYRLIGGWVNVTYVEDVVRSKAIMQEAQVHDVVLEAILDWEQLHVMSVDQEKNLVTFIVPPMPELPDELLGADGILTISRANVTSACDHKLEKEEADGDYRCMCCGLDILEDTCFYVCDECNIWLCTDCHKKARLKPR